MEKINKLFLIFIMKELNKLVWIYDIYGIMCKKSEEDYEKMY